MTLALFAMGCIAGVAAEAKGPRSGGPWTAPAKAVRQQNPVPRDQRSIAKGRQLYIKECLPCHGSMGKGDGAKASDLKVHPGDLSRPETLQQTDGALFWKLTTGRTPMPAYRSLAERERWMLIHYLRTFAETEARVAPPKQTVKGSRTPPRTVTVAEPPNQPGLPRPADSRPYVSREEYESLKSEHAQLKQEIEALKAVLENVKQDSATPAVAPLSSEPGRSPDLETGVQEVRDQVDFSAAGTTQHLLTGFASAGFASRDGNSLFSAGFTPILLWKLSDRILFEAELDLSLETNHTDLDLERAQIYYLINDYMTVGAGKFLSPMNFFEDRLHQINKMPDAPLAIAGLLPRSNVGMQVRGGIPLGTSKLDYAFHVANAPGVHTQELAELGSLQFDEFDRIDGELAVGGRVAIFPMRELQLGYGFQFSGVDSGPEEANALLQSIDFNYVRDFQPVKGTVNVLAQWVWSHVGSMRYDADGSLGFGPLTFNNRRNGGYVQIAYRPTMLANNVVKRLEPMIRYDRFNQSRTPAGFNEQRWSIGLNYWILPSAVIKAAYQFDDRGNEHGDALLLQFKIGF